MTSTKPPSGTRDFLPEDVRRREHVMGVVRDVYERYGYAPLETPAFENLETLVGKYGEEGNKLIFKILKRGEHETSGEADLALRYDLTVPLARVVAQHQNELPRFFKRYQMQPVWRADRPAKGRFREFYQCDIDAIGSPSPLVEVEQIAAVAEVLARLGFADFLVRVNHRLILSGLLNASGVPDGLHADALIALDKLDKIGADGVARQLESRGINATTAKACLDSFHVPPAETSQQTLARLRHALGQTDAAVANLEGIVSLLSHTGAAGRVRIDLSLARGLSYYTGAIMEVTVPDLPGSLGGGGRYDNLIGMFLGRNVPACGFSLGLERIIVVMTERQMFPAAVAGGAVDIMVTIWEELALRAAAIELADSLRKGGLRVEVYPEPDKLGRQFKYAADRGTPFVAVQGGNEVAARTVTIKDLRTGEQAAVTRDEAPAYVSARLRAVKP
ncbi:MAG TPA: histidine--tRNA ligase [Vicinamibacterales bacterium]|nr:histidine--tRNA ligase [Vicinamibacterales bacterium]